jgi:hypothetical protein
MSGQKVQKLKKLLSITPEAEKLTRVEKDG